MGWRFWRREPNPMDLQDGRHVRRVRVTEISRGKQLVAEARASEHVLRQLEAISREDVLEDDILSR